MNEKSANFTQYNQPYILYATNLHHAKPVSNFNTNNLPSNVENENKEFDINNNLIE